MVRWIAVIVIYAVLFGVGWLAGMQFERIAAAQAEAGQQGTLRALVLVILAVFVFTSALPFVPGAEIGLALMAVFGGAVAPLVYAAMVTALMIAYLIGLLVLLDWIAGLLRYLGARRALLLLLRFKRLGRHERLDFLVSRAPRRWVPVLLRHRYLALVLLFNLPGNSVVGGGGGIAMVAGMSGLFRFPQFMLTVLIAIAPVPLSFYLMM